MQFNAVVCCHMDGVLFFPFPFTDLNVIIVHACIIMRKLLLLVRLNSTSSGDKSTDA